MLARLSITATFAFSAMGALAAPHLYIRDPTDDYYGNLDTMCQASGTCRWWFDWAERCGVDPSSDCTAQLCDNQANFNEVAKCFYCLDTSYVDEGDFTKSKLEEAAAICSTMPDIPPFVPIPGDPCFTDNGRFGTYQGSECIDLSPDTAKGGTCYLKDGSTDKIGDDGTCGSGGTAAPKEGDPCKLDDGTEGKLQSDLKTCKAESDPNPGKSCKTEDGEAGTVQEDGTCKATEVSHTPGDACELGGDEGVYDNDGKTCVFGGDSCKIDDGKEGYRDPKDPRNCLPIPVDGTECETAKGQKGKYDKGNCVVETPITEGSDCSTGGKQGKIVDGKCKPNDNSEPNTPTPGTVCWSGGEKGIVNTAGQCIITQRIGVPVDNTPEIGGATPTPKTTSRSSTSTSATTRPNSGAPATHASLSVVLACVGTMMVL